MKVLIARQAKKQLAAEQRKLIGEVKEECRSDGLKPLLMKLNLSPRHATALSADGRGQYRALAPSVAANLPFS